MTRVIIIILLTVGLVWIVCNQESPRPLERVQIDPRLMEYVKEWCWEMEQAGLPWEERLRRVHSILVVDYSVDSRHTGETDNLTREVTINSRFLDRNPCAVKSTVFHELGHAAFDLQHDCCTIMRSRSIPKEQEYCDRWDLYLSEYLVQCKKAVNER